MGSEYGNEIAIKQAIIDAFTAEQGAGGKLSSVLSIGTTVYPETTAYPYIGVERITDNEDIESRQKRYQICHWVAGVSVRSTTLLADAIAARELIVNDGQGNGVKPLIRAMTYSKLGGLIFKCEIGKTTLVSNVDASKGSAQTEFYADAVIEFDTWESVNA